MRASLPTEIAVLQSSGGESGCIIALTARIRASLVTADIRSAWQSDPRATQTASHDSPSPLRYQPFDPACTVDAQSSKTAARRILQYFIARVLTHEHAGIFTHESRSAAHDVYTRTDLERCGVVNQDIEPQRARFDSCRRLEFTRELCLVSRETLDESHR